MFQPFETLYSLYCVAIPSYEWMPVAPPAQPTTLESGADRSPTLECRVDAAPRPMQLVFEGFEWRTYGNRYLRDNAAWQLCTENRREQDEERPKESRPMARVTPPASIGNDPSWDAPQSRAADAAGKLGNGTT
ncbi:MAG TPA: hypothetical protein VFP68_24195 [Burkholderiaceae bacterium]|nr:hypothetical protein [Burkholderiaceae bacterium]